MLAPRPTVDIKQIVSFSLCVLFRTRMRRMAGEVASRGRGGRDEELRLTLYDQEEEECSSEESDEEPAPRRRGRRAGREPSDGHDKPGECKQQWHTQAHRDTRTHTLAAPDLSWPASAPRPRPVSSDESFSASTER